MYDASLDEFTAHKWNFNPLNTPVYYSNNTKNATQSFNIKTYRPVNTFYKISGYPSQSYDQLNWFGFYFGNDSRYGIVYDDLKVVSPMAAEEV